VVVFVGGREVSWYILTAILSANSRPSYRFNELGMRMALSPPPRRCGIINGADMIMLVYVKEGWRLIIDIDGIVSVEERFKLCIRFV
jgi:hypothetical protein